MPDRHPAAILLGALAGLCLAELATASVLLATWRLLRGEWLGVDLFGCAAAFGAGLGVAFGAAEVMARRRGLLAGLLVLATAWPLAALGGAHARLRLPPSRPLGELEAIEQLRRQLTDAEGWWSGLVLASVVVVVHGALLAARLRERDLPAQAIATTWGALAWLGVALWLPSLWPGEEVELWVCLLLLAGRAAASAPALAACDRAADRLLAWTRGQQPAPPRVASRSRWRLAGLALGGALGLGVAVMPGIIAPREGAAVGVARFQALFGQGRRHTLAQRLVWFDPPLRGSRTTFLGPLDVVAWGTPVPRIDWSLRHRESLQLLRDLAVDGHPPAIARLTDELGGAAPPLTRAELVDLLTPAAEGGDPVAMRALGALLVVVDPAAARGWLERAALAGEPLALVVLATRLRARHDPETTALLRQALRQATRPDVRARVAAELEWAYERAPAHRSSVDPAGESPRFIDAQGRPLDGAVTLALRFRAGEPGWRGLGHRFVRRPVQGGRLLQSLVAGVEIGSVWYSWDLERARANVVDGTGLAGTGGDAVVRVALVSAPYGAVSGRVRDLHGRPVADALVQLIPARDPEGPVRERVERPGLVVSTDLEGRFEIPDLPPGDYELGLPDGRGLLDVRELVRVTVPGAAPVELEARPALLLRSWSDR